MPGNSWKNSCLAASAAAGGAIVFAARSVSRRKKRIQDEEAAKAASREATRITVDEKHPHHIVGLCGEGFKISSREAAPLIEADPYAFHYRDRVLSDVRYYISVERFDWVNSEGRELEKPELKGDIVEGVFKVGAHDTLGLLEGCCGEPEGGRPPWCPAAKNIPQPNWQPEQEGNSVKRKKEAYKVMFGWFPFIGSRSSPVVYEQRLVTGSLRKAKRVGKQMLLRHRHRVPYMTSMYGTAHIVMPNGDYYHEKLRVDEYDMWGGPYWH